MIIKRIIFHVDVNSAFLSWSAVERLNAGVEGPDLRDIPSAVTGNPESRHGIILAKSIPAKRYHVTTGEPTAAALRKCPDLLLVRPDFTVYNRQSKAFIAILKKYAPVVEQVSIDEAFCDFTGTGRLYGDYEALAGRIRAEIYETLGFTVNIGISENKLLAKMASDFRKPNRTHTLYPEEVPVKMWPLPIGELFGVGEATAERLMKAGIRTIGDAAARTPESLGDIVGSKAGLYIHEAANGRGSTAVKAERDEEQSVGNSTTLSEDLTPENADRILRPTLLALAESVGTRLRRHNHRGRTVAVTIKNASFKTHSRQIQLDEATDSTDIIFETAVSLFEDLWNHKDHLRLLGITVSGFKEETMVQLSLFKDEKAEEKKDRLKKLDAMTDAIRGKYGKDTLVRGSLLGNEETRGIGRKHE